MIKERTVINQHYKDIEEKRGDVKDILESVGLVEDELEEVKENE